MGIKTAARSPMLNVFNGIILFVTIIVIAIIVVLVILPATIHRRH